MECLSNALLTHHLPLGYHFILTLLLWDLLQDNSYCFTLQSWGVKGAKLTVPSEVQGLLSCAQPSPTKGRCYLKHQQSEQEQCFPELFHSLWFTAIKKWVAQSICSPCVYHPSSVLWGTPVWEPSSPDVGRGKHMITQTSCLPLPECPGDVPVGSTAAPRQWDLLWNCCIRTNSDLADKAWEVYNILCATLNTSGCNKMKAL